MVFVVAEREKSRREEEGGQQDKGQTGKRSYKMNKSTGNTALEEGQINGWWWKEAEDEENENEIGMADKMERAGLLSLPKTSQWEGMKVKTLSGTFLGMLVWWSVENRVPNNNTQGQEGCGKQRRKKVMFGIEKWK